MDQYALENEVLKIKSYLTFAIQVAESLKSKIDKTDMNILQDLLPAIIADLNHAKTDVRGLVLQVMTM